MKQHILLVEDEASIARGLIFNLEAEGYRVSKEHNASGEGDRFTALASEYAKARDVTSFRLYVQAMEESLAGRRKFIVSPDLEPGALDLRVFARGQSASDKSSRKSTK